jgi:hypothetical protein
LKKGKRDGIKMEDAHAADQFIESDATIKAC